MNFKLILLNYWSIQVRIYRSQKCPDFSALNLIINSCNGITLIYLKIEENDEDTSTKSSHILLAYHFSDILKITIINNLVKSFAHCKTRCPQWMKHTCYSKNMNCGV